MSDKIRSKEAEANIELCFWTIFGLWIVMQLTFVAMKGNGAEGLSVWGTATPTFVACGCIFMLVSYMVMSPTVFSWFERQPKLDA